MPSETVHRPLYSTIGRRWTPRTPIRPPSGSTQDVRTRPTLWPPQGLWLLQDSRARALALRARLCAMASAIGSGLTAPPQGECSRNLPIGFATRRTMMPIDYWLCYPSIFPTRRRSALRQGTGLPTSRVNGGRPPVWFDGRHGRTLMRSRRELARRCCSMATPPQSGTSKSTSYKKSCSRSRAGVDQASAAACCKAPGRAGIDNFRWHDLRHTWANRQAQDDTRLIVLHELEAWTSDSLVHWYAPSGGRSPRATGTVTHMWRQNSVSAREGP
jgi:hypothetical protein